MTFNYYVKKLKKEIQKSPIFVDFYLYKNQLENNKELIEMKKNLAKLQHFLVNSRNNEEHNEIAKQYKELKERYDTNPIVENYNALLLEVKDELLLIKETIEL